jgi:AcrR family transcriptional regulator
MIDGSRFYLPATTSIGRPRDPAIDVAVLGATRALLLEVGYGELSIGLVSRRTGVNRPAIYRRWPSKMHLVYEAVFPDKPVPLPLPVAQDSGDFATDLRSLCSRMVATYARPEAQAALPGLIADMAGDSTLRHSVVDRLEGRARQHFTSLVERAVSRGQIAPGVDAGLLFDCIVGSLLRRVAIQRQVTPGLGRAFADLLLEPLLVREEG